MASSKTTSQVTATWKDRLVKLQELQESVINRPYSIVQRLRLALAYRSLGYPDLALGDAYKALLLADEVADEGEFHEQALRAAKEDITSDLHSQLASELPYIVPGVDHTTCTCTAESTGSDEGDEPMAVTIARNCWSKTAYAIVVQSLIDCGCLRSAFDYITRALQAFPSNRHFKALRETILQKLRSHFSSKGDNFDAADVEEYPDMGLVRREKYPWNNYEPDRFSEESLRIMNEEMALVAPKLEIKKTTLLILSPDTAASNKLPTSRYVDQLGIFAKEDIPPGEVILEEKSLLTAVARLRDSFCDACSIPLSKVDGSAESIIACDECEDAYFCSSECYELAQDNYHPALCGVNIDQKVSASESSDFLYSLLLIRALALAEVQNIHPLELKEVRFIWGDYHGLDLEEKWKNNGEKNTTDPFSGVPQTLPFSFKDNILTPLNILERMDINIYEHEDRYDTWVFNTLYAKFRGTASARQGLDRRPEVSAVHPMWCMGNHSCDPNVAWEWEGSIRFWTREELVPWEGRDPDEKPGLRRGEELRSHYCDVSLPVKERREWAVGALGGDCMCPRCVWEAAQENT
ncbi:uncharacterized protein EI97DRAFT_419745 [Westerdykella ornata]|uniref:SET domain-containing protein n=1 Tax=Westerdykella ornata TaxID=318751 RepID=A0A6A6JIQ7_WESOR|nr:uncharacterized protein EI97DRAFT_419745 [Westerdykella ornata]KAF2275993.1 hypothetical protein EI97DRAFT_419745 [Westerdykella ornata]